MRMIPGQIGYAVAIMFAVGAGATLAQDASQPTPESLFNDLFGARAAEVAGTATTEDDVLFARGLIEAAKTAKSNKALAIILCDKAYEAAMRAPNGFDLAVEAVTWVIDNHPDAADGHRQMLREAYQRRYATARGDEKAAAGAALLNLYRDDADALIADDKLDDAATVLRQAMAMATALRSPLRDEFRGRLEAINKQLIVHRRIDQLKQHLKDNPTDEAKARDLVMLYIVDLDRPVDARKYTFLVKDEALNQNIRDAGKAVEDVEAARLMTLGDWYQSLALQAASTAKWSMLDRAARYYEAYTASGADDGLAQTKAKLSLQRVRDLQEKLGEAARPTLVSALPGWAEGCVLALTFDTVRVRSGRAFTYDSSRARQDVEIFGGSADTGVSGKCLVLDGVDDYAQVAASDTLHQPGDVTIAYWINVTNLEDRAHPFNKSWGAEGAMTVETTGVVNYYWGTSGIDKGEYQGVAMKDPVAVGQWTHLALTRDLKAGVVRWYKNGKLVTEDRAKFEATVASQAPLLIGKGYTPNFLAAKIDELAFWGRALSPEEIAEIYTLSSKGVSYCDRIGGRR